MKAISSFLSGLLSRTSIEVFAALCIATGLFYTFFTEHVTEPCHVVAVNGSERTLIRDICPGYYVRKPTTKWLKYPIVNTCEVKDKFFRLNGLQEYQVTATAKYDFDSIKFDLSPEAYQELFRIFFQDSVKNAIFYYRGENNLDSKVTEKILSYMKNSGVAVRYVGVTYDLVPDKFSINDQKREVEIQESNHRRRASRRDAQVIQELAKHP